MIAGLLMCTSAISSIVFIGGSSIGFGLLLFGVITSGIACLGRGCNICGKTLEYREFGFLPQRLHQVVDVVASEDIDRVIQLLKGPRSGDLDDPRTALMISCCPGCKQIAELCVGEYGHGFRTCIERVYDTPDVARLRAAVRKTKKTSKSIPGTD